MCTNTYGHALQLALCGSGGGSIRCRPEYYRLISTDLMHHLGVKVVFQPQWTLRRMLVRLKDPVPVEECKGVVYSIPCGHAVDLSQSEKLDHHQHTTTHCMWRAGTSSTINQAVLNRERGTLSEVYTALLDWWACIHLSPCFLFSFFFFLYVHGFVSIVNNLTQHWCAWHHVTCMCMGTRTDWHVPKCIGGESGYLPYILAFNIHLTVL